MGDATGGDPDRAPPPHDNENGPDGFPSDPLQSNRANDFQYSLGFNLSGPTNRVTSILILKNGNRFRAVRFDHHAGLRYPRLERIEGTLDQLGEILMPRRR